MPKKKLEDARLKIFRKDLRFFGISLYKFILDVIPLGKGVLGCVAFNVKNLEEVQAGKIYVNEDYVKLPDFTYNNLVFVLIHELMHIINKHVARMQNRIPMLWNLAADHVVNTFIIDGLGRTVDSYKITNDKGEKVDGCFYVPELKKDLPNCSTEEAYDWLYEKNKDKILNVSYNSETGMIDITDANGNLKGSISPDLEQTEEEFKKDGGTSEELNETSERVQSQLRAIYNAEKSKGDIGSNIISRLDVMLKIIVPWTHMLERTIKKYTQLILDGRSWRRFNNYYRVHGYMLPGSDLEETKNGIGTLIIGNDTSGSISEKELSNFTYIIHESLKYFEKVIVINHDVEVHQEKEFEKENFGEFLNFIKTEGYKGRGGTSHKYLFERVETLWEEDIDSLSMFISLTDGYSDIENICDRYKFIKNVPSVILITPGGKEMKLDERFDKIEQISMKDD